MTTPATIAVLRRCPLFSDLSDAALTSIIAPITVSSHRPGDAVLHQGEPGLGLCILLDGIAKVRMHNTKGGASDLAYLASGDAFGEISLFTGSTCTADILARTEVHVLTIPKEGIGELIQASPEFSERILRALAQRIKDTDKLLADISFNNLEGRIASKLLHLAGKFGETLPSGGMRIGLILTHAEIAELAGTSRETVTKILGVFRKEGSISIEERDIVILDMAKLKAWTGA